MGGFFVCCPGWGHMMNEENVIKSLIDDDDPILMKTLRFSFLFFFILCTPGFQFDESFEEIPKFLNSEMEMEVISIFL